MIAATLSLDQAAAQLWDAVVVGAGPAGALAAGQLARQGASVLLVDRAAFPRAKVCGCCINPRALAALSTAGLDGLAARAGAKELHSLYLAAGRRSARVRLQGGVALSRSAFDGELVRSAIGFGAAFLPSTIAELGTVRAEGREVLLCQRTPSSDTRRTPPPGPLPEAERGRTTTPPPGPLPEAERGRKTTPPPGPLPEAERGRKTTPPPGPLPEAERGRKTTPPPGPLPEAERGRKTDPPASASGFLLPPLRFGEGGWGGGVASLPPLRFGEGGWGGGVSSRSVHCRLVLAADGLGSLLLSRAGVSNAPAHSGSRIGAGVVIDNDDRFYAPGVVFMSCGQAGYIGLARLEDGRLDLACALDACAVRAARGPAGVVQTLIADSGWPVPPGLDHVPWRGTVPLTRQATRVADYRLFALGDATGYVEPFTGEGIGWALASALAVTPLALRAIRGWQPELSRAWKEVHHTIVTRRQVACRLLAGVLRRPWLTAAVVAVLSRLPSLADPVLHYLNDSNGVTRLPRAGRTQPLRGLP